MVNKYVLPLGFIAMDENVIEAWDYSDLDEITAQNKLAELLGADETMLTEIPSKSVVGESTNDRCAGRCIFLLPMIRRPWTA